MPQAANRERGGVRSRGDQTSTRRVRAGDNARTDAKKVRLGLACSHRSAEQRLEKTVRSPQLEGRRKTPPAAPSSSWAGLQAGTTWFRLGKFAWAAEQRRPRHEVASDGPIGPRRRKVSRESPAAVCIRQRGTAALLIRAHASDLWGSASAVHENIVQDSTALEVIRMLLWYPATG